MKPGSPRRLHPLLVWNRVTLAVILLLVLAGGIVRSSGSGMGCPDWPLCFGQWIPPLEESELPANYQEIYAERGYKDTRFNAVKTWTEYLNRLLGALTGIMVLVQAVWAIRCYVFAKSAASEKVASGRPVTGRVLGWALLALLLVLVQGGVGAWVVAAHLEGSVVTLHLGLAWLLMAVQLWMGTAMGHRGQMPPSEGSRVSALDFAGLGLWLLLLLGQLFLGARVRELVDTWMPDYATEVFSLGSLGEAYLWHKNVWMLLMLAGVFLGYRQWTVYVDREARVWSALTLVFLGLQVLSGVWMALWSLPPLPRTLHIVLGSLTLVAALGWWTRLRYLRVR
jgi:cytochrome c oxidase assembly protein subunit 15